MKMWATLGILIFLLTCTLVWLGIRTKPELPNWKSSWYPVEFTNDYWEISNLKIMGVREGPYIVLVVTPIEMGNVLGMKATMHKVNYRTRFNKRERTFVARQFPLKSGARFNIYRSYRGFMDGGWVLQLIAVAS